MSAFRYPSWLILGVVLGQTSAQAYADNAPWDKDAQRLYDVLTAEFDDQRGNYQAAMDTMARVSADSKQYESFQYTFNLAMDVLNYQQAESTARSWVATFDEDLSAHWSLVQVLLASKQVDEAFDEICLIFNLDDTPHHVAQLSRYLTELPDSDARLALLQRLSKRYPDNAYLYYYIGIMAKEQGKIAETIAAFNQALALEDDWPQLLQMQAKSLASIGQLSRASEIMDNLLAKNPDDEYLLSAYIDMLVAHYQWPEAIALAERWRVVNPESVELRQLLAWLYGQRGEVAKALPEYRALLDEGLLGYDQYLFSAAQVYGNANDMATSVALLAQVPENSVLRLLALQQIALNVFQAGNIERAQKRFAALRQEFPDYALEMYLLEANQLDRLALWAEGDQLLAEAKARYGDQVDVLYALAKHESAQHNTVAAEAYYRQILSLDAANIDALNAYGYLLLTQTDRQEEAAQMIKQAIAQYVDSPAIQDSYGWLLYQQGKPEEALIWLRRAYAGYRSTDIVSHYIDVLMATDKRDLAEEVYRYEYGAAKEPQKLESLGARYEFSVNSP
ncbi:tetratricopeptide repeat protein [Suttonella sp. R2A3]|uniref:tetratricopeptide repeat protein n=1 Tax=Suttonella sp. R2A3 TaxID=2908648 RepID=UPI001F37F81F|nr:tetratricopeptide repeat protein [Suttonella sp. R2A3]UJF23937.1 tetratricopeptide repeat protein [Suttonella sp. R2A3]